MARMNVLADVVKGLKANIHAVDNLAPVSRVAVYVRAGSRYEPDATPGVSHYIRAAAGLTTQDSSIFGITRYMERAGASFRVTSNREYIIYRVDCLREKLGDVLGFIDDTIHKPEFRTWELHDVVKPRLKEELGRYKKDQAQLASEAMHKVGFRGGLAHPKYLPEHQIEKITKNDLFDYLDNNYVLERMSVVGLGVDENELRNIIDGTFSLNNSPYKGVTGASRYCGGEARIQAGFPHTMVNFVVQGCPITDLKTNAALEVIGCIIGAGQPGVKYGQGAEKSLANLLLSSGSQFSSSIINFNYTDTGLFGFSIKGPNELLKETTKRAVHHVRTTMTGITEAQLATAKKAAKVRNFIKGEDQCSVFRTLGNLHAAGIVGQSPVDHIDKLTLKDIQTVVNNLLKSKPTIASVGNPRFVPYIDELD